MFIGKYTLASMLVMAGTAMVALTGIATVALSFSTEGVLAGDWKQISIMILSSSCATIFVLGLLHSDL